MPISRMSEPIFHRLRAIASQRAVGGDHRVERRLGMEVAVGLAHGEAGQVGQPGARVRAARRPGHVDPGADGRPAEGQAQELVERAVRARRIDASTWPA